MSLPSGPSTLGKAKSGTGPACPSFPAVAHVLIGSHSDSPSPLLLSFWARGGI